VIAVKADIGRGEVNQPIALAELRRPLPAIAEIPSARGRQSANLFPMDDAARVQVGDLRFRVA
jgi:hypothetical protein